VFFEPFLDFVLFFYTLNQFTFTRVFLKSSARPDISSRSSMTPSWVPFFSFLSMAQPCRRKSSGGQEKPCAWVLRIGR